MPAIRDADPVRDGGRCAEIYAPYVTATAVTFEEEPVDAGAMTARIRQIQLAYPWLVAEAGGELTGYAYASRHRKRSAYRWAVEVGVYVDRARHRRGVGRALYGALLPRLAEQGYRVALAGITLPNPASVALHEACGFRHVGTYRAIGWKVGGWRDVGWWQAALGEADHTPPGEPAAPAGSGG